MWFASAITWLALLIVTIEGRLFWYGPKAPLDGNDVTPGSVWPKPVSWTNDTIVRTLDPTTFLIVSDVLGCDVIDNAIIRYLDIINLDPNGIIDPVLTPLTQLSITVQDQTCQIDHYPYSGMDESYTLDISGASLAALTTNNIWGALRGLETFSQLLHLSPNKEYHIKQTIITDTPRFPYRGILIDTARHFLNMNILYDILDAMSWDKFNVFHWHVVDDQSFPFPSTTYPQLQNMGSYSPDHQYSVSDVSSVIEYARLRGIRVIPEFDSPGHTYSWGRGYPELLTPCWGQGEAGGPYVPNYPYHADAENMNPMEESTFEFMDAFFQEVVTTFPDQSVHLGMDEAYYDCWMSNPNMTTWMADRGYTEYFEVEQYFDTRLINIVNGHRADIIMWQDPLDNKGRVPMNTTIEVWKDTFWQEAMLNYTTLGYNTLLSAPWYLNYISYGEDWRVYYEVDPYDFTDDDTLYPYVHGGEACMWGEFVDGTNVLERLWPRVSAVGERLWSPQSERNTEDAKFRLDEHRCRYLRRGFPAQPILNGYCGDYEWQAESQIHRHM